MTQFQENEKNYRDEEESPVADDQDTSEEPAYWSEHQAEKNRKELLFSATFLYKIRFARRGIIYRQLVPNQRYSENIFRSGEYDGSLCQDDRRSYEQS